MKNIIFALLLIPVLSFSQGNSDIKYIPFVKVKDTVEEAYWYSCDHPNCWGGVTKEYIGLDTLRIYRTYIQINSDSVLIDEKKIYVTKPKGNYSFDPYLSY